MTEAEKQAIERMKDLIHTCEIGIKKHGEYDDLFQKDKEAIETVLNLIEKKDQIIRDMKNHINAELKMIDKCFNDVGVTARLQYDAMRAVYKSLLNIFFDKKVEGK